MRAVLTLLAALFVAGCAGLSGLDADTQFKCQAPEGVPCVSVSGTYLNVRASGAPPVSTEPALRGKTAPSRSGAAHPPAPAPAPGTDGAPGTRSAAVLYTTPGPLPTALAASPAAVQMASPAQMNAPTTGTPLRIPERNLRIWLAPFRDREGDLHDQRYVYVTVSPGQWTLEASRAAIRNQYQTVRPLSRPEPEAKPAQALPAGTPFARPAARLGDATAKEGE